MFVLKHGEREFSWLLLPWWKRAHKVNRLSGTVMQAAQGQGLESGTQEPGTIELGEERWLGRGQQRWRGVKRVVLSGPKKKAIVQLGC